MRKGATKILCPFHEEKTPSLVMYQDVYHCFGCGRSGTLIELARVIVAMSDEAMAESDRILAEIELSLSAKDTVHWPARTAANTAASLHTPTRSRGRRR